MQIYNAAARSYEELKQKTKQNRKTQYIDNIRSQMREYYNLARTLEGQGKYIEAESCYKKIMNLSNDVEIKRYLKKKNEELKEWEKKQEEEAKLKRREEDKAALLREIKAIMQDIKG